MNWQTMETAPKDGTHILLFVDGQAIEGWWEHIGAEYGALGSEWCVAALVGCGCRGGDNDEPTHWAVLDTPNKEQNQ